MNETLPVLYILMRNDLDTMNPGKAMAQASHASNAFVHSITKMSFDFTNGNYDDELMEKIRPLIGAYDIWKTSTTQGFGTVLVLGVNEREMRTTVDVSNHLGYVSEVIHDPTYPIVDGKIVHYIPLDTCAYVFYPDKNTDVILPAVLDNFPLHP